MHRTSCLSLRVAVCAIFMLTPVLLSGENPAPAAEDATKLIDTLKKADAPIFEKAKACQRLAVVGTKDAVPVLAGLLGEESLAHYARFALEPIPDASVDEALRSAMTKLKGRLLVGVINSIGTRRDAKALEGLTQLLGDADLETAAAATAAVGRLGTPEAAKTLTQALSSRPPAQRPAVAEACLACAERLLSQEKRDEAYNLYDTVRKAELPDHVRAAATRGAIVARQAKGAPLLVESLQSGDGVAFAVALVVAREIPGEDVTAALVKTLPKLTPERQGLVIGALSDRGDRAALPAVLEAARGGSVEARTAAILALKNLGDASAVPVLVEAAAGASTEVAMAAKEALKDLGGKEVDAAIVALLGETDPHRRSVLVEVAGRRRIQSAVPALRKAADAENETVRLAALRALGMTAGVEDLGVLISRSLSSASTQDAGAAEEALRAAAKRLTDKDGCAGKVLDAMASAPPATKARLIGILGSVGGARALKAVSRSTKEADASIRSAALKVLSEWPSEDAAPEILAMVKDSTSDKDRMDLLRAFKNVVSKLRFPKEQRLALCARAMDAARNDEERKVVLETLAALPAVETLAVLAPYFSNPSLKDDACAAAVTIGERILRYNPGPVRDSMKQVVQATANKDVVSRAKKLLEQSGEKQ